MVKNEIISASQGFVQINNVMSTKDFVLQNTGESRIYITTDNTIDKNSGLILEVGDKITVKIDTATYIGSGGDVSHYYMDDSLIAENEITIDTSSLATSAKQDTIITGIGTVNTGLSDIDTKLGTINTDTSDIKDGVDGLNVSQTAIKTSIENIEPIVAKLDPTMTWTNATNVDTTNFEVLSPIRYSKKGNYIYLEGSLKAITSRETALASGTEVKFFDTIAGTLDHSFFQEYSKRMFMMKADGSVTDELFVNFYNEDSIIDFNGIKFLV